MSHLVNEGGKFVVEGFDLFLLLLSDPLDAGVNLQVEGFEKVLVDGDFLDAPSLESRATHATTKRAISIAKATTINATSATTKTCRSIEATTPSSHRDPLASTNIVEAFASKATTNPSKPAASVAVSDPGDRA